MTCGIDFAGVVSSSDRPEFAVGRRGVVTGWGLSETRPGGYTERQRVPASVLTARPGALSLQQAMAIGTAGLTAMLCVLALEDAGLTPDTDGEVIVTGAAGGVGSVAVAVLAKLGYQVAASTGRPEAHDYLQLARCDDHRRPRGAARRPGRPLDKERWAGADRHRGQPDSGDRARADPLSAASVAACGLAGGNDLPATVLPFILRGVSLLGIDSVMCPAPMPGDGLGSGCRPTCRSTGSTR